MKTSHLLKTVCAVLALWSVTAINAQAQTFTTLANFNLHNGDQPDGALIQGTDGNLYGTASGGGLGSDGTIFRITAGGTLTKLHDFGGIDGAFPESALVLGTDGNLYGTTQIGGPYSTCNFECGTVFKITSMGGFTSLYSFCALSGCPDGSEPTAGLLQATDGNFYGTTSQGAGTPFCGGCGTVFRITPAGVLTTVYSFCSQSGCLDGSDPQAALIQASDGNFYGTTIGGGAYGYGTVFKLSSSGALTTLHSFNSSDGANPAAALVQATDRNFYGTTNQGGSKGLGTVFKITPAGTLTTLYSFCSQTNCVDGEYPWAGLIQATDGNFYGTTVHGGTGTCNLGCGTLFAITPSGTLTTLHNFCTTDCIDGGLPFGGLVQATDGNLYGTAEDGGSADAGSVFSLSVGLGPFVEALPNFGKAGATVRILGTNLTGTTAVTFNGIAASYTVVSPALIRTSVPAGATTGTIEVATPGGTLTSNLVFRIK